MRGGRGRDRSGARHSYGFGTSADTRRRLSSPVVLPALVGLGAVLRVASGVAQSRLPLEPDARGYLRLAEAFDYADPWAASLREPLWVALVKTWSAPFGYSPVALRTLTVLLSITVLAFSARLFTRHLSTRLAAASTAVVSCHGLLVLSAGRGLREELVGLLVLVCAAVVLERDVSPGRVAALVVAVAALSVVRLEMAVLAVALLLAAAAFRQVRVIAVLLAAVAALLAAGPWLASNQRAYGSATASADDAALFWYRVDRFGPQGVLAPDELPPHSARSMTWSRYVRDEVGPLPALARASAGTVGLVHDGVATAVWPLEDRWVDNRTRSTTVRGAARAVDRLVSVVAWMAPVLLVAGIWAAAVPVAVRGASAGLVLAGAAAYGLLWRLPFFDLRFIQFAVPFLALLTVAGVMHLWDCLWTKRNLGRRGRLTLVSAAGSAGR